MNLDHDVITANELNELRRNMRPTGPRAVVWSHMLTVLSRHHIGRAQVIQRYPDILEVAADTLETPAPGTHLHEHADLQQCLLDKQARVMPAMAGENPGMVTLIPLQERNEVTAILRLEHEDALSERAMDNIMLLAFVVSACLTDRSWEQEAQLKTRLTDSLATIDELATGVAAALSTIVPAVGASSGTLLEARSGCIFAIADHGEHAIARRNIMSDGLPFTTGLTREVLETGEIRFTRNYHDHPAGLTNLPVDPVVLLIPWITVVSQERYWFSPTPRTAFRRMRIWTSSVKSAAFSLAISTACENATPRTNSPASSRHCRPARMSSYTTRCSKQHSMPSMAPKEAQYWYGKPPTTNLRSARLQATALPNSASCA